LAGNTVSVLLNSTAPGATTPSFATQQSFDTGSSPSSVAAADVNGDGQPDLIVANGNAATVSVLLNELYSVTVSDNLATGTIHYGTPTPIPIATPTPRVTPAPSPKPAPSPSPTPTPIPSPTPTRTRTPTPRPTPSPTPGGTIAVSANPLVFPNAGFGGAPKLKTLTVRNLSARYALVGDVEAPLGPFSIVSGGGAFDLSPHGTLKVRMMFTPTGLGLEEGSLAIVSNDEDGSTITTNVNLTGTGEPGVPKLSTADLSSGTVGIGVSPKTLTLRIHNSGQGALGGSVGVLATPFAFTAGNGVFGPIAPGGRQSVSVQFTPTQAVLSTATLAITTTEPAKLTIDVPISGTGGPGHLAINIPIATTFTSANEALAFGAVKHGTAKLLSFKIKNVGTGELLGNVGSLPAPFTVTSGGGSFSLAPRSTEQVTVQFAPTAAGQATPQPLAITVTASGNPPAGIIIAVSGRGT
jgi:hypothetical protein